MQPAADSACALPVDQYRALLLHACKRACNCSTLLVDFEGRLWGLARLLQIAALICLLHTSESQPLCVSKAPRTCIHPHLVYLLRLRRTRYAGDLFDADLTVRKNSVQQTRNSSTSSSAGLMLLIITGRPQDVSFVCGYQQTKSRTNANSFGLEIRFRRSSLASTQSMPTIFLCPHSPLLSLSVCPPMICALTCSNKP